MKSTSPESDAGQETLDPVLHAELARCKKFELVFVSTGQLQEWTGRARWKAEEKLPLAFFQKLREELGCDAVLFCRLSHYRPYAPLQIGWNLKLVDSEEPRIWWSVDELFDAGEPATARAAQRFYRKTSAEDGASSDAATVLASPRRFGQFAIHAVLATLPER